MQPEDLPRYAAMGISPAFQPWHMLLDMADLAKDDAVGPERAALSWPLRSMIDSGANIHLGSDFPVVGIEPCEEIYGAVYRMLEDGSNPEGWFPEERITMAEALRAYTYGSAYAMGVEDRFGTLAAGKVADICELKVNGKDAGMKWFGERIYDISPYVRGGENAIEVKVTTLMGNYIQTLKDNRAAQRFVLRRNQPYVSAGLIGPVKLYK